MHFILAFCQSCKPSDGTGTRVLKMPFSSEAACSRNCLLALLDGCKPYMSLKEADFEGAHANRIRS
jgi:hypothetical protein